MVDDLHRHNAPGEPSPPPPPEDSVDDLYENAPCGYLSTLADGTILRANQTFLTWTGHRREDLVGVRRFQDLLTPGGRLYHETHYAPLLRMQGEVREIALDVLCADNRRLPVLVNSVLRADASGEPRFARITIFDATDRRRYERELLHAQRRSERSEARVRILQRLTADLAATTSVADVVRVITALGGEAFNAAATIVWLLDAGQGDLMWTAVADLPKVPSRLRSVPRDAVLPAVDALRGRDVVLVESVEAARTTYSSFAELMRDNDWESVAVMPLVADDELGVVALTFSDPWSPDDDERALLRALGRQMGQALQRVHLFEVERGLRERAEVLQRITALLATGRDPHDVAAAAVAELVDHSVADMAMVALAEGDGDRLVPVSRRGSGSEHADVWASLGLPVVSTGTDQWMVLDQPRAEPGELPPAVESAGGLLTLSLAVDGWSVGRLYLGNRMPRRFSPEERAFLAAFASQCAQAFERARLHRETVQQAERSAFLARLSGALDEVPGLAERARRLVDLLVPEVAAWASVDLAGTEGPGRVFEAPAWHLADRAAAAGCWSDPNEVGQATATAVATGKAQWVEGPHSQGDNDSNGGSGARCDCVPGRVVALPLRARGSTLGALTLMAPLTGPFQSADLPFLDDLGYRTGLALENARLYEHERETAHILQQSMLTGEPPDDPRIEIATWYLPGTDDLEVGGDWYDSFPVGDGKIGIVVGDVVGRGINAASTMGQLRSATRALAGAQLGPARLLEHLDQFVDRLDSGRMATLVYAEICLDTGVMRYACAGHPPPILIEETGDPQMLWSGRSMPLGIRSDVKPRTDAEVTLRPGTRLLLYTDGLVENRISVITDGMAQVAGKLGQHREAPPAALLRILTDHMLRGRHGDDDVCLLCISFKDRERRVAPPIDR